MFKRVKMKVEELVNRKAIKDKFGLLEEVEEIERGMELFTRGGNTNSAHFEMVAHYGDIRDRHRAAVNKKFNKRLLQVMKEIKKELEEEIKKMP